MSGPRILLLVMLVVIALLWAALVGDRDADIARGIEETDLAFAAVEAELAALDPLYQEITKRGLMLNLKTMHDDLRSRLASLRDERLRLGSDTSLDRRERLPAYRDLVQQSDELLASIRVLREHVRARYEFMTVSSPLLQEARGLRDRLAAVPLDDATRLARAGDLAGRFSELEELARSTDRTLQQNIPQGQDLGHATLAGLAELIQAQKQLLAEVGQG